MDWFKAVILTATVWSGAAWATFGTDMMNPTAETPEVHQIGEFLRYFDRYYPNLQVSTNTAELSTPQSRKMVLDDLIALEHLVHQQNPQITPSSLMHIRCTNVVCGEGDPGSCHACDYIH